MLIRSVAFAENVMVNVTFDQEGHPAPLPSGSVLGMNGVVGEGGGWVIVKFRLVYRENVHVVVMKELHQFILLSSESIDVNVYNGLSHCCYRGC